MMEVARGLQAMGHPMAPVPMVLACQVNAIKFKAP